MNNKYYAHFYIKNNTLRCVINDGEKEVNLKEKAAVELLKEADKERYPMRVKHGKIMLIGDKDNLTIEIDENIFLSEYKYLARKTFKALKRTNRGLMNAKYKNKSVEKALTRGTIIRAGSLAAIFIAVALAKPEKTNEPIVKPVGMESVQDNTDEKIYLESKSMETQNYLSNIDGLFEEVEEIEQDIDDGQDYQEYIVEELEPVETHYSDINLDIEDRSQEDDVIAIRNKYHNEALRAQQRWGIDARILLAMLTQESHDNYDDLMQIKFNAFINKPIKVYNFQEQRFMKVVFTNNAEYFSDADMTLSEEELKDPITQIGAAAIIMNYNNLNDYNAILNPAAMIDEYNKGLPSFIEVLDYTPGSREEILRNPNNIDFLAYDKACGVGDPEYVLNTMQYVDQSEGPLMIYTFNKDNEGNKYPVRVQFSINKTLSNTHRSKL